LRCEYRSFWHLLNCLGLLLCWSEYRAFWHLLNCLGLLLCWSEYRAFWHLLNCLGLLLCRSEYTAFWHLLNCLGLLLCWSEYRAFWHLLNCLGLLLCRSEYSAFWHQLNCLGLLLCRTDIPYLHINFVSTKFNVHFHEVAIYPNNRGVNIIGTSESHLQVLSEIKGDRVQVPCRGSKILDWTANPNITRRSLLGVCADTHFCLGAKTAVIALKVWHSQVLAFLDIFSLGTTKMMSLFSIYLFISITLYKFRLLPPPFIRRSDCTYSFSSLSNLSATCRDFRVPFQPWWQQVAARFGKYEKLYVQSELLMMGGGSTRNMWSDIELNKLRKVISCW
jgi:hypothetical protein